MFHQRCDRCDWSSFCVGGKGTEYQKPKLEYLLPGILTPINAVPFDELNVRFNLCVTVDSVTYHEENLPDIKIIQDGFRAKIDIQSEKNQNGEKTYTEGLSKNDLIYLENVVI